MKAQARLAQHRQQRGFTMIEVLVALVIVAVALAASIRAVGSIASSSQALHKRLLAGWSADTALVNLPHRWPALGATRFDCPQGDLALVCTETVSATPNPTFRRVDVTVTDGASETQLAQLVMVLANEPARPL